ncbi:MULTISPECIES: hypothetical protein [Aphanothece]|uniref:hypothetical protein n=1 Tax=Aphanothece TaxID=1121 RepID=UPI00398E9A95
MPGLCPHPGRVIVERVVAMTNLLAHPMAHLIGRPLWILGVGLLFALAAGALSRSRLALLTNAMAWLLFAIWEALVLAITPEANIRVDLLLIGPLRAGLGLWALLAVLLPLRRLRR